MLAVLASIVGPGSANAAFEQFAIAPDGKTIAYVFWGHDAIGKAFVAIADSKSGKKKATFPVPMGLTCLKYAPDGKTLVASVSDGTIRVHDADTGKEIRRWKGYAGGHSMTLGFLSFTPDGKSLVSIEGTPLNACVWDPATGKEIRRFELAKKGEVGWSGLPVSTGSRDESMPAFLIGDRLLMPSFKKDKVKKSTPEEGCISAWSMVLRSWDITTGKVIKTVELGNSQVKETLEYDKDYSDEPDPTDKTGLRRPRRRFTDHCAKKVELSH